jgi:hypothetical protein
MEIKLKPPPIRCSTCFSGRRAPGLPVPIAAVINNYAKILSSKKKFELESSEKCSPLRFQRNARIKLPGFCDFVTQAVEMMQKEKMSPANVGMILPARHHVHPRDCIFEAEKDSLRSRQI